MDIAEVRSKFPQYADMSDDALASALHRKYYSDIPPAEFAAKIGLNKTQPKIDHYAETAKADGFLENIPAAVGGVLAGVPVGIRQRLGMDKPGEVKEWKDSMAGLWSTPGGKAGTVLGGIATAAPAMFIPGVNTAGGAAALGAINGLVQPTGEGESALTNTIVGGLTGGAAQAGVNKVGTMLANRATAKAAELTTQKAQNAVRDATLKTAQDAGYVLPPSQVSPTLANRALEGFAGKLTTAQQASAKNQSVTNQIVRKDLGLPPDAPLTFDTMATIRADAAAKGYEPLKQFGQIAADKPYADKLYTMLKTYEAEAGNMKSLRNPDIEAMIHDANQVAFDSQSIVPFLRNLREQGFSNRGIGNNAPTKNLGKVQIDLANAIEDLTERNLAKAGAPEVLQNFREARKLMAKSFTAQKAINPATGNIDASKIGAMFKKDKPLSGGMKDVGRAAAAFPFATKEVTTSLPGLSPLDYMGGMMTGAATGPLGAMAAFARPAVRSSILSKNYQKALVNAPSYKLGLLDEQLPKLLQTELAGLLGASQVPALLGRPE